MASTIVTKNSSTASAVPVVGDLTKGELAVNVTDKRLFTKDNGGLVVEIGTNPSALSLPNGTANGVAYLNGSKVVTTGSALTFDGTNFGTTGNANLGSASKSTDTQINLLADTGTQRIYLDRGSRDLVFLDASSSLENYRIRGITGIQSWGVGGSEQMRLTSTGLGIGTSSPSQKFVVYDSSTVYSITETGNAGAYAIFEAKNPSNSIIVWNRGDNNSSIIKSTAWDFQIGTDAAKYLSFFTNSSERARIDSSGNLLVGTTSASGKVSVEQSADLAATYLRNTNASFTNSALSIDVDRNTNNSSYNFIFCAVTGVAARFLVRDSGNCLNTNNSYGGISDIKLKENIVDATPKLEKLNQVRVVNYNLIGEDQKQIGVIAQELEQIFPSMVEESPDRDADGNDLGTTTKSVKYSVFVPMLIKAIQEQQAQIESLTQRLAAAGI